MSSGSGSAPPHHEQPRELVHGAQAGQAEDAVGRQGCEATQQAARSSSGGGADPRIRCLPRQVRRDPAGRERGPCYSSVAAPAAPGRQEGLRAQGPERPAEGVLRPQRDPRVEERPLLRQGSGAERVSGSREGCGGRGSGKGGGRARSSTEADSEAPARGRAGAGAAGKGPLRPCEAPSHSPRRCVAHLPPLDRGGSSGPGRGGSDGCQPLCAVDDGCDERGRQRRRLAVGQQHCARLCEHEGGQRGACSSGGVARHCARSYRCQWRRQRCQRQHAPRDAQLMHGLGHALPRQAAAWGRGGCPAACPPSSACAAVRQRVMREADEAVLRHGRRRCCLESCRRVARASWRHRTGGGGGARGEQSRETQRPATAAAGSGGGRHTQCRRRCSRRTARRGARGRKGRLLPAPAPSCPRH